MLAGTPLAGLPLQNVTLGQVLANTTAAGRLNSVPVGSINLSRSPLGSLTPAAIGLGSTPVGSIPVPPATGEPTTDTTLQRWCRWLSGPPINCTSTTSLGTTTTMVSAALQGAPVGSIPVGSIPVGSIPINSIPVGSIKLGNIPVGSITVAAGQHQVLAGRLDPGRLDPGQLDPGRLDPGRLDPGLVDRPEHLAGRLDPGRLDPGRLDPAHLQLPDRRARRPERCSATAAQLKPGLTLEQLLRADYAGRSPHHLRRRDRLHDAVGPERLHGRQSDQQPAAEQRHHLRRRARAPAQPGRPELGDLDLTGTPIQNFSTGGSTLGYQADFHLAPNGGPAGVPNTATLDVSIPPGFVYQAGQHPAL